MATAALTPEPVTPVADPALATPPEAIDFDKMFDELADEDRTPPVVKPVEPAPVEAVAPVVAPVEEIAEPELLLEAPVTPAKVASDDDILKRFAELVQARQEREAQPPATTQQPYQQPAQPAQPQEYFSPEEKTALATFEKDWPDVAKAMAVRERALAQQLVGYVFNEVANTIRPLFSQVRTVSEYSQIEQINALVPDYDKVREPVLQWIEQQPAYLKPAYEYVRDHGTAEEVADLIHRYRQTTGSVAPPIPAAAPVVRQEEPSLPAAAKKAVASLAPVGSKRSVVVQGNDPNNFDAAFDTFASS